MPFPTRSDDGRVVRSAALSKLTHEMQSVALIEDHRKQERQDWS